MKAFVLLVNNPPPSHDANVIEPECARFKTLANAEYLPGGTNVEWTMENSFGNCICV
jgi:hypothetical protein